MATTITKVTNLGNDIVEVEGVVAGSTARVTARGWVSATTNHYDPADYGEQGHRVAGAKSRAMTKDELAAYYTGLLEAQNPSPTVGTPMLNPHA